MTSRTSITWCTPSASGFATERRWGPIRVDLAYSINPPTFNGLQGTYDQLLSAAPPRPSRTSATFNISSRSGRPSNMRSNLYLGFSAAVLCFRSLVRAAVVDRVAVVIGKTVITESECWTISA